MSATFCRLAGAMPLLLFAGCALNSPLIGPPAVITAPCGQCAQSVIATPAPAPEVVSQPSSGPATSITPTLEVPRLGEPESGPRPSTLRADRSRRTFVAR